VFPNKAEAQKKRKAQLLREKPIVAKPAGFKPRFKAPPKED
jgi:hypothetical protein